MELFACTPPVDNAYIKESDADSKARIATVDLKKKLIGMKLV
jgi:hypothetical protein